MGLIKDILGVIGNYFYIGSGSNRVGIRSNSGTLQGQNSNGTWTDLVHAEGDSGVFPKHTIPAGTNISVGEYGQYVIHGKKYIIINGTLTLNEGAELLYRD